MPWYLCRLPRGTTSMILLLEFFALANIINHLFTYIYIKARVWRWQSVAMVKSRQGQASVPASPSSYARWELGPISTHNTVGPDRGDPSGQLNPRVR